MSQLRIWNPCPLASEGVWTQYETKLNTTSGSTVMARKEFRDGFGVRIDDNTSTINMTGARVDDNGLTTVEGGVTSANYDLAAHQEMLTFFRSLRQQVHVKDVGSSATEPAPEDNTWGITGVQLNTNNPSPVQTATDVTLGEIVAHVTQESLFIEQTIEGDANLTASGVLEFRRVGETQWRSTLGMHRVNPTYGVGSTDGEYFNCLTGLITTLAPGTEYEVRVTVSTTSGVIIGVNPNTITVKTKQVPSPGTGTTTTVNNRAELNAALSTVAPGDTIILNKDNRSTTAAYYTNAATTDPVANGYAQNNPNYGERIELSASGTADNPIILRGATDDVRIPMLTISGDHIWLDNLKIEPYFASSILGGGYTNCINVTGSGSYAVTGLIMTRCGYSWDKGMTFDYATNGETNAVAGIWHDGLMQFAGASGFTCRDYFMSDLSITSEKDQEALFETEDVSNDWIQREGLELRGESCTVQFSTFNNTMDAWSCGGSSGGQDGLGSGNDFFNCRFLLNWDDIMETDHGGWGGNMREMFNAKRRRVTLKPPSHPDGETARMGFGGLALFSIGQGGVFANGHYGSYVHANDVQSKSNGDLLVKVRYGNAVNLSFAQSQFWFHRDQGDSYTFYREPGQSNAFVWGGCFFGMRRAVGGSDTFSDKLWGDTSFTTNGGVTLDDTMWDRNCYYGFFKDDAYTGPGNFAGYPGSTVAALSNWASNSGANLPAAEGRSQEVTDIIGTTGTVWTEEMPMPPQVKTPAPNTPMSEWRGDWGTQDFMVPAPTSDLYGNGLRDEDAPGLAMFLNPYLTSSADSVLFTKVGLPPKDGRDIGPVDNGMGHYPNGVRTYGDYIAYQLPDGWEVKTPGGDWSSLGISSNGVERLIVGRVDNSVICRVSFEG